MFVFYNIKENKNLLKTNLEKINPIILFEYEYEGKKTFKEQQKEIEQNIKNLSQKNITCILLDVKKIDNSLSGVINSLKNKYSLVIAKGDDNKTNRFLLENTNIDLLLNPHNERQFDSTHCFNSGLNQVLVNIAKHTHKGILISTDTIIKGDLINIRSVGKIQQNIKILDKKSVGWAFVQIISKESEKIIKPEFLTPFFNIKNKRKTIEQEVIKQKIKL